MPFRIGCSNAASANRLNLPPHDPIRLMNPLVVSSSVNVWTCLESSRGLTAVAACWRQRVGEQFDAFKAAFLQRAPGVAKGLPCPRGCACTHEIVLEQEFPSPNPIGRGARG